MKVAVIATITVKDGEGPTLEALFEKAKPLIAAGEPGTLVYELTRSREDANQYKVLEIYRDAEALEAHGKSEGFAVLFAGIPSLAAGPPTIEVRDLV